MQWWKAKRPFLGAPSSSVFPMTSVNGSSARRLLRSVPSPPRLSIGSECPSNASRPRPGPRLHHDRLRPNFSPSMALKFRIEPRDVPPEQAARRLGKTLAEFQAMLGNLLARGFPAADPDTGNYDLHAIDRWCDARHIHLFGGAGMQ